MFNIYLYINVCNSQIIDSTQLSISKWKSKFWYTPIKLNESQIYYVTWKKPNTDIYKTLLENITASGTESKYEFVRCWSRRKETDYKAP